MGFTHRRQPPDGERPTMIRSTGLGRQMGFRGRTLANKCAPPKVGGGIADKAVNMGVHDPTVFRKKPKEEIKPYDADEELNQKFIDAGIITDDD